MTHISWLALLNARPDTINAPSLSSHSSCCFCFSSAFYSTHPCPNQPWYAAWDMWVPQSSVISIPPHPIPPPTVSSSTLLNSTVTIIQTHLPQMARSERNDDQNTLISFFWFPHQNFFLMDLNWVFRIFIWVFWNFWFWAGKWLVEDAVSCIQDSWCGFWRFGHVASVCVSFYELEIAYSGRLLEYLLYNLLDSYSYRGRQICWDCTQCWRSRRRYSNSVFSMLEEVFWLIFSVVFQVLSFHLSCRLCSWST